MLLSTNVYVPSLSTPRTYASLAQTQPPAPSKHGLQIDSVSLAGIGLGAAAGSLVGGALGAYGGSMLSAAVCLTGHTGGAVLGAFSGGVAGLVAGAVIGLIIAEKTRPTPPSP